jgi:hypothetical protein
MVSSESLTGPLKMRVARAFIRTGEDQTSLPRQFSVGSLIRGFGHLNHI